jgi:hypothetical protein
MFFIFGWGRKTVKDYGPTIPAKCGNCNNNVYFKLVNVKLWFTLFFVPVFPYESKYILLCSTCSRGRELYDKDIEKAKNYNRLTTSYLKKEITDEQYRASSKNIGVFIS